MITWNIKFNCICKEQTSANGGVIQSILGLYLDLKAFAEDSGCNIYVVLFLGNPEIGEKDS